MEFPPTIYIGIGVVAAAIIIGTISFINLIISKDQKTSEFCQRWIEALREDNCSMLADMDTISATARHYRVKVNNNPKAVSDVRVIV